MPNYARLDLSFSSALSPVFFLVPTDNYNLIAQPARLIIRSKAGIELFNQIDASAGITIIDHVLTDDLQYPDGSVIAAGETVKAWRVAPDLSGVPMADPLNTKMQQNWYGFTADPGGAEWVTEGFWDVWPDTGPVPHCNQNGLTGVQVGGSVAVAVFFPGTQGLKGDSGAPSLEDYALRANVLELDNTTPFMPVNDYEPVTKIYQDLKLAALPPVARQTQREITDPTDTAVSSDWILSINTTSNDVALTLPETGSLKEILIRHDHLSSGTNIASVTNNVNGETGPWRLNKGGFIRLTYIDELWITSLGVL